MGLNFDFNGKYVGWSNLFDYSSEKTISKSEYLPMPKGKKYKISQNGIDITNLADEIIKIEDSIDKNNNEDNNESERIQRLDYYIQLLNMLKDTEEVSYNGSNDISKVIDVLNQHERTTLPPNLKELAYKNFIASHIQNTVQSLENSIKAYSPIEMEVGRNSLKYSPKTKESDNLTLLSPSTKFIMQFQNLSGKKVVGIAANGEKGSFMWHYYLNDAIKHPEKYDIENAKFEFKTERILGRKNGNPQESIINMLPGVHITPEFLSKHPDFQLLRITDNLAVDLMISQMVSLATDNAKELVLAKINAGDKLAKCHLFLITLGYDIDDIVSFMTSPVVNFIDTLTNNNIFSDLYLSEQDAIKIARGDFKKLWDYKILSKLVNKYPDNKGLENQLRAGIIPDDIETTDPEVIDQINLIKEIKALMNFNPNSPDTIQDILELENILEGANEFTSYTQALGLNQGIKTSKSEIQKNLQNFSRAIQQRAEATSTVLPPEFKNFDPIKFVNNTEYKKGQFYRDDLIEFYNKIKKCINIFDHLDKIPQFKAIMQLYAAILQYDQNTSIKTKIFDSIYKTIKDETLNNISESYLSKLVHSIDNNLVVGFFSSQDIKIPFPKNKTLFYKNGVKTTSKTDGLLSLNSIDNIQTFKYFMENDVIPNLKNGKYYVYENNNTVEKTDQDLISNNFIIDLIKSKDGKIPLYKCDINMLLINKNYNTQIKYGKLIRGLQALSDIKINDSMSLSDLFVLYNLIINKNNYGSDRMTGIMDGLLKQVNSLSIINDYLSFIGDIDYFGEIERKGDIITVTANVPNKNQIIFEFNYKDNLYYSSNQVYTTKNQKDPSYIFMDQNGMAQFFVKKDNQYKNQHIFSSNSESSEEDLERIDNINKYRTLGGHLKGINDLTIDMLHELNNNTLQALSNLILKQVLRISKVCK